MEVIGRDKSKKDTYMLQTLLDMFSTDEIRNDHPLQRQPDQWSKAMKSGLATSVIKREDIDSVKICEQINGNTVTNWLIDGLQRLTTLDEYRNNSFAISKKQDMSITYIHKKNKNGETEAVEYDLRGKYYSDLPTELKRKFDSYPVDVVKREQRHSSMEK